MYKVLLSWLKLFTLFDYSPLYTLLLVSFDLYDLNRDNKIDRNELQIMLKAALMENQIQLTDAQIDHICSTTLQQSDSNGNGSIEYGSITMYIFINIA